MERVRARARDHVHNAGREPPEFRAETVGDDAKLHDGVRIWQDVAGVSQPGRVGTSIQIVRNRTHCSVVTAIDERVLLRHPQRVLSLSRIYTWSDRKQRIDVTVDEG